MAGIFGDRARSRQIQLTRRRVAYVLGALGFISMNNIPKYCDNIQTSRKTYGVRIKTCYKVPVQAKAQMHVLLSCAG